MTETIELQTDIKKEKKENSIGTTAYKRFLVSVNRTRRLLKVSLNGLEAELEMHNSILTKVGKALAGEETEAEDKSGEELVKIELNTNEITIINDVMKKSHEEHAILDKYIFSILNVFVWGTFETYLNQAFSELFRLKPIMLKTEVSNFNSIDILDNLEDPLNLLINKEINKLGHFKLKDWSTYLDKMINFKFNSDVLNDLKGIYLVRNIVAHNTGVVRPDQYQDIPNELEVIDNEIVVSNEYLLKAISTIEDVILQIEHHIQKKYYKSI